MARSVLLPAVFILCGIGGLVRSAVSLHGEGDPALYHIFAGKILGRPTWLLYGILPPDDPDHALAPPNSSVLVGYPRLIPYWDFRCEYPPAALVLFLVPRFFTGELVGYYYAFSAEMAIFAVGLGIIAASLARTLGNVHRPAAVSSGWAAWIWAAGPPLLHRFDVAVVFFMALGIWFALRRNWIWAGAVIGIGIAIKLYPVFLLFPLAIAAWKIDRQRAACGLVLAAIVAPLLSHLAMLPWAGISVLDYLQYHGARGIEIESTWGTLVTLFAKWTGAKLAAVQEFGAVDVAASFPLDAWITASYVLMLLGNLSCAAVMFRGISTTGEDEQTRSVRLVAGLLATTALLIASTKVLSVQYVQWLYPMAMVLPGKKGRNLAILYVITLALAQIWSPYNWEAVKAFAMPAVLVILVRNVLLFVIAGLAMKFAMAAFISPTRSPLESAGH